MENKVLVREILKARKENNREKLEALAVENIDLVLLVLDMEDYLNLCVYDCGTLVNPRTLTVIKVYVNNKRVDLRNKIVKQFESMLDCWDSIHKQFVLSNERRA